jgi:hypothetical protein
VDLAQQPHELEHAGLLLGARVQHAAGLAVAGGDERAHEIADVEVVAGLRAVPVDRRRPAVAEAPAEDRDDAGLAAGILPRPVDVAEAQGHRRQPVQALVQAEVALGAELALAVARHRQRLLGLGGRQRLRLAVDRSSRGGEHEPAGAALAGRLQHVDGAEDVDLGVERGGVDRHAHVDLRGEVEDPLGAEGPEAVQQAGGVADVAPLEHRAALQRGLQVDLASGGHVVDDEDLIARVEQRIDEVGPDEAGAAGDH